MTDLDPTGLKNRKAVLGDAHVERSLARRTPFTEDWQAFITRYAWGEVWERPGLTRPTRSMLTLAITAALGREEEFKLHVRATRNTGVSREEIREVLIHTSIYAGVPAANSAFRWAEDVFAETDAGTLSEPVAPKA